MKTIKELKTWKSCCRSSYKICKKDVLKLIDEWWNLKSSTIEDLKARITG